MTPDGSATPGFIPWKTFLRAEKAGWHLKDFRGIRDLADYVQEPTALSHEADLMRLEAELGRREPFRRTGRYLQCCFGKP